MKLFLFAVVISIGGGMFAQSARAEDPLPQASSTAGSPSSNPVPTTTTDQPGDITLTPENPVSNNPLPPIPKLELSTPKEYEPVLPSLNSSSQGALYGPQIYVKAFEITGNTVYDSSTLAKQLDSFTNRKISGDELEAARQTLTLYYVNHGYINSGAILPDQDPKDGIIHFQIVEGKLTTVEITGNHWFQTWWLRNEMRQAAGQPLNFNSLKQGMQLLRENPTIAQVNAELQPAGAPGEGKLKMEVKDTQPFRFHVDIDNHRPPSVGSVIAQAHLDDLNLTGNNDQLSLTYGIATSNDDSYEFSGFDNVAAEYRFPISPWHTTMDLSADKSDSGIVEAPFNQLNIVSKLTEFRASIRQPVFETPKRSFVLTFEIDSRRNKTSLFGQPFSLSPGAVDGVEDVTVPRFIQEFVDRSQFHVFSFRSQFSYGIDALHATINANSPDGHFFDWLGQAQYIRRIDDRNDLIVGRLSGQIADRPLLSLEQLQIGGVSSVRGYLENQALTDNGVLATIEGRIPIWSDKDKNPLVQLAPFIDCGVGWDNTPIVTDPSGGGNLGRQGVALPSAGIGILFDPIKYVSGQLYWGYGFNRRQVPDGNSLQNQGIEFSLTFNAL